MLKLAAIVLTAASLGGLGLIAAYQWGPPRGRVWLPGAAHGLLGVAGTVLLAIGLQGPPRGAGMGMASFGLVSAGLLIAGILLGSVVFAARLFRARRLAAASTLVLGVHATLAIAGLVILAAYLSA